MKRVERVKAQYCHKKGKYINPQECTNTTDNCFCDCHSAILYFINNGINIGRIVSKRSLLDDKNEIEPVTYLFVEKEHLDILPELVKEALKAKDMSILLRVVEAENIEESFSEDKIDD